MFGIRAEAIHNLLNAHLECIYNIDCGIHGTCNLTTHTCVCTDGYTGSLCETKPGRRILEYICLLILFLCLHHEIKHTE